MPLAHFRPTVKSVNVVNEKDGKAYDERNIFAVLHCGKRPEYNENDIVKGIAQSVIRTSAQGERNCGKTCQYGDGAHDQIVRAERIEDKVKCNRNYRRCKRDQKIVAAFEGVYLYFPNFAVIGVFKPVYKRCNAHGRGHAEIGDHFAVIVERERYISVKSRKKYAENLTRNASSCNENQGGCADERSCKIEIIGVPAEEKGKYDRQNGTTPKQIFERGKTPEKPCDFVHISSFEKRHPVCDCKDLSSQIGMP